MGLTMPLPRPEILTRMLTHDLFAIANLFLKHLVLWSFSLRCPVSFFAFVVLLELPLPTALPQTVANKSLLYHPRIVADVQRVLSARPSGALVQQLCSALRQTNTDHM